MTSIARRPVAALLLAACLGALATAAFGADSAASASRSPASGASALAGALADCRVPGITHGVLCGSVSRPLNPARPGAATIDVHFVVVPAMARRKLPDPVFLLAGGPGQSAISLAPALLPQLGRLNNRRDLVFVDQRGTGRSAPLMCADTRREPLADQSDPERQFQRLMDCKAALLKLPYIRSPADLGAFTTVLAMQDLEAVRRQLGAPRINLIGASYGTRAALDYQRQFPAALRRAVLDGVAPPDMVLPASIAADSQAALDALWAACAAEPACARAHPALRADWAALLAGLPKRVTVNHPLTGAPESFTLTREMVLGAVRGPLYAPALAAALPVAIDDAAHGRFGALMGLNAMLVSRPETRLAMGMHFSVVCAEDVPRLADAAVPPAGAATDFSATDGELYRRVCADWPRGEVPAAFYTLPPATSPALLLSGGLDPATPPRHAARVAQALGALARSVIVPNAGHGVMGIGCMRDVVYRFIDAADDREALAVDAGCAERIPRPPAFQPLRLEPRP